MCLLIQFSGTFRKQRKVFTLTIPPFFLAIGQLEPFIWLENPQHSSGLNFLLTCLLIIGLFWNRSGRDKLLLYAFVLLALSYAFEILFLIDYNILFWNIQHAGKLIGLVCFVLQLEKRERVIFVQFFLRLNLVLIVSAGSFMLVIAHSQRENHMEATAANVRDLTEFLRGHVVYYHRAGEDPSDFLDSEILSRRIVIEFGRIPDLKEVRVDFLNQQLWAAIGNDGVISYEVGSELFSVNPELIFDFTRRTVTVHRLPIVIDGQQMGDVEIGEDLQGLTQRISRDLQFLFLSFTVIAVITQIFVGFVVLRAHKLIEKQYRKLDERQRELMQASHLAAIGQLVGGVAHEVNNPAGVILIRSECALSFRGLDKSVKEDLLEIRTQAARVSKIVRNLLAFSRPKPIRLVDLDLNEIVKRSLVLLNSYSQLQGFEIKLDLEKDLPHVTGDPDRLEQVVLNIGKNAIDAMPNGGKMSFSTKSETNLVRLEVSDTGTGIPTVLLEKIFDPFFTTKEVDQGTGLGLAISSRIIRDHHGKIEVESGASIGTTFQILLPIRRINQ